MNFKWQFKNCVLVQFNKTKMTNNIMVSNVTCPNCKSSV